MILGNLYKCCSTFNTSFSLMGIILIPFVLFNFMVISPKKPQEVSLLR